MEVLAVKEETFYKKGNLLVTSTRLVCSRGVWHIDTIKSAEVEERTKSGFAWNYGWEGLGSSFVGALFVILAKAMGPGAFLIKWVGWGMMGVGGLMAFVADRSPRKHFIRIWITTEGGRTLLEEREVLDGQTAELEAAKGEQQAALDAISRSIGGKGQFSSVRASSSWPGS